MRVDGDVGRCRGSGGGCQPVEFGDTGWERVPLAIQSVVFLVVLNELLVRIKPVRDARDDIQALSTGIGLSSISGTCDCAGYAVQLYSSRRGVWRLCLVIELRRLASSRRCLAARPGLVFLRDLGGFNTDKIISLSFPVASSRFLF